MAIEKVTVLLLTGYLGSGKTTLLNRILQNKRGIKFAVIVNDIGEVNIDAELIAKGGIIGQQDDSLVALQNGCICCTLKMDLVQQLTDITRMYQFDYIVIEASGICEPAPMNKAGEVEPNELGRIREIIRAIQPKAEIIECDYCDVDLDRPVNTGQFDFDKVVTSAMRIDKGEGEVKEEVDEKEYGHHHKHDEHHHDHHEHHACKWLVKCMQMKSFRLFWRAIKSTRQEMWVSVQMLIATTLVLSLLLFLVEHRAQPEVFRNYWDALLWSFMGYIEDPGEFAPYTPITFWGRVLKIACALVNIAIFAVPAGLVAGGFSDVITEDKHERKLKEMRSRLKKMFRREQTKDTNLKLVRTVPRYVPLTNIQVRQQFDTKDIIDAVRSSDEFRLNNLANAQPDSQKPQDRLVIENIPTEGRTSYGCCIDRGSRVTIMATSVYREVGSGKFAYYLALFGGFNYISKEYQDMPGEFNSYYWFNGENPTSQQMAFLADLQRLRKKGKDRWIIALIAADSVHKEHFHFVTAIKPELDITSTIIEKEDFKRLYQSVAETMKREFKLESDCDVRYRPVGPKNICVVAGGGKDCNAFTLRVDWNIIAFNSDHVKIIFELAKQIAKELDNREVKIKKEWKSLGYGYPE